MSLPSYTETRYRIWHYFYIAICTFVFFFLIAPLFVIFPLSFNAEEFLVFSEGMKRLDPDAFSFRWYHEMVYGTKNPWGLAAKPTFAIKKKIATPDIINGTIIGEIKTAIIKPLYGMCLLLSPRAASVPKIIDPIVANIAMIKLFFAASPHGFLVP